MGLVRTDMDRWQTGARPDLTLGWSIGKTAQLTNEVTRESLSHCQAYFSAQWYPHFHLTLKLTCKLILELGLKLKGTSLHELAFHQVALHVQ